MKNKLHHRSWISGIGRRGIHAALGFVIALGAALVATSSARAQGYTESILYNFTGGHDGETPLAGLILDKAGNLYGTASLGGASETGTVFKVDTAGKQSVLYSFDGPSGAIPASSLVRDTAGNLYGTTEDGGSVGVGVVFKLGAAGTETTLYSFCPQSGCPDGQGPAAGLVRDAAGNLYGTTEYGGIYGYGTVFAVDTTGKETVLHNFDGGDGAYPKAGLVRDSAGNVYGTTEQGGGLDFGTVFELSAKGLETVLYSFEGGSDGEYPVSGLVGDSAGNLYGTAKGGGVYGLGVVFKLNMTRAEEGFGAPFGTEGVLHSFTGHDGADPQANLILDAEGNLYGTTEYGGASSNCSGGCGTVFKLTFAGTGTLLHSFTGQPDGEHPAAGLVRDAAGNLYGTTQGGGSGTCTSSGFVGCGTVFKLTRQ